MTYRTLMGAAAALAMLAGTLPATAEEVVLRYSNWVPATHPIITKVIEPLSRDLEEATEGRVSIEVMPALGPPPGHFDLVENEVADMAFSVHGYTPGRFSLTEIGELPFTHNNAVVNSLAYWNTYQRFMMDADEHEGVRLLGLWTNGPYQLTMYGDLLTSIDSVEGKRIRVPGPLVERVSTALGMVPISSSVTDSYEQISRGVINGMFQQLETVWNFNLTEYLTHVSVVPGGFAHSSQYLVMSNAAYERLSEEDRAALDELTGEALVVRFAEMWQAEEDDAIGKLEEAGTEFLEVSEEVQAELRERLAFIEDEWVEAANERGVDGAAALAFYRAEIDRISAEMGVDN
ncbi:ABC transporter substrate-binding protein [Chelativorans sp. ZYF759]|uniref:TRAP transporter substrate-binding protein n=1 Tax=Chelativorans sp. ZYF759 TaxID=2692213 RepID=UPI00145EDFD4|nr:TRAP transporter substrate-binding protein [Chelativorans sp. ZYF759]NMG40367.1 ABC transporter substrate-binding protein [Chelativorans sp. ZYF759]